MSSTTPTIASRTPRRTDVQVVLPSVHLARDLPQQLIEAEVSAGRWTKVRRGAYVASPAPQPPTSASASAAAASASASASPSASTSASHDAVRQLELARIAAVSRQLTGDIVFTHQSAALLWGLPLWRPPATVHVNQRSLRSGHASRDVTRHSIDLSADDVVERSGVRVTSLERTVVDCARSSSAAGGLVVADAALRRGGGRDVMHAILETLPGARGVRLARTVVGLANGASESAWETVTRLVLHGLGFPAPALQVPVVTHLGTFFVDLGWEGRKVAVEFDGLTKYTTLARGDPGRVIFEEKRRQDAIEESGWRVLRATRTDLRPPDALGRRVHAAMAPAGVVSLRPVPLLLHDL